MLSHRSSFFCALDTARKAINQKVEGKKRNLRVDEHESFESPINWADLFSWQLVRPLDALEDPRCNNYDEKDEFKEHQYQGNGDDLVAVGAEFRNESQA